MRGHVQVEELGGLLLVARGEGDWWAVTDRCRQCHEQLGSLAEPSNEVAELLRCPACGCPHGPDVVGCSYVPSLAVDDEVYVLVR